MGGARFQRCGVIRAGYLAAAFGAFVAGGDARFHPAKTVAGFGAGFADLDA